MSEFQDQIDEAIKRFEQEHDRDLLARLASLSDEELLEQERDAIESIAIGLHIRASCEALRLRRARAKRSSAN